MFRWFRYNAAKRIAERRLGRSASLNSLAKPNMRREKAISKRNRQRLRGLRPPMRRGGRQRRSMRRRLVLPLSRLRFLFHGGKAFFQILQFATGFRQHGFLYFEFLAAD